MWAKNALPAKNTLLALDARRLEEAFTAKLADFAEQEASEHVLRNGTDQSKAAAPIKLRRGVAPKSIRLRDKERRKFVSRQPCLVCGRMPCDAHHLRFAQPRALGLKVSDEYTVPLCRTHHHELHQTGREEGWWATYKIDPTSKAAQLWKQTRGGTP